MSIDEIVRTFEEANRTADAKLLSSLYAPGAVVWHNFDAREIPFEESVANFLDFHSRISEVTHEIRALLETPQGFVLQARTGGRIKASGKTFRSHNCLVFTLEDGLVCRLDEYVDPAVWAAYGDDETPTGH